MKKILLLFLAINSYSQAPTIQWQKSIGGSSNDIGIDVKPTSDGGYIALGSTTSNNLFTGQNYLGSYDIFVVKTDATGNIQWQKTYGGSGYDVGTSIQQTTDSGYIISGYTSSTDGDIVTNHGGFDSLVMKLNTDGNLQWLKTYGGSAIENSFNIIELADGSYVFSGHSGSSDGQVSNNHGSNDAWIVKLDASGALLWQKSLGGSQLEFINKILPSSDNGFVIVGHTNSANGDVSVNHGGIDGWVVKLNAEGNLIWEKTFGSLGDDYLYDISKTADGGYIASGQSQSVDGNFAGNHGLSDAWMVKMDAGGNTQWQKIYGGSWDESLNVARQTSEGNYIFAGVTYSDDGDTIAGFAEGDVWVVKVNNAGEILWQKRYGGSNYEEVNTFVPTSDQGYIFVAPTTSNNGDLNANAGQMDFWLVKLDPENLANTTFAENNLQAYPIPTTSVLYLDFPNPIENLSIIDVFGKTVSHQTKTGHSISVQNLASGLYIVKITAGGKTYQTKFVKL